MKQFTKLLTARKISQLSRRRYQKGTLTDGGDRWEIRWREDSIQPLTGELKRVHKWDVLSKKQYPTKRLAQRALDDKLREVNREDYKPTVDQAFGPFAEKWMETVMIHHKPSTQASERGIVRNHLVSTFGGFDLKEITAEVLQTWVSDHPASPKTIRNIVDCLRSMWTTAKAWNYVQHNPFDGLRFPKKVAPKTYSFSMDETVAIIELAQEPWKTLFRIVAETGIRSGEVAGLRIEDFDAINLTLAVRQSVWNSQIQTPKTANAIRREPISANLAAAIQRHIDTMAPNQYGLLFAGKTGQPLQMIHFMNRVFRPLLEELGIRQKAEAMGIKAVGLHALRRMNGTQMDEQGVPLKTRQDRMGHANAATTLYHYTKPIDEASRRFADRMGTMLDPKREGQVQ